MAHFICGCISLPRSLSSQPARGIFLPTCPVDWVTQMKPILFVVGVLFSCLLVLFFSGSVLFLFCRHLEMGNFAPTGTAPIPWSQFAHQRVCTCVCEHTLYTVRACELCISKWKGENRNSLKKENRETTARNPPGKFKSPAAASK